MRNLVATPFHEWFSSERKTNLGLGLLRGLVDVSTRAALLGAYAGVAHLGAVTVREPASWAAFASALLAYDFLYYWAHRAQHRIGVLWAVHAVHHQAHRFDVSVGLRVGMLNGLVLFPFFLPLALLGVPGHTFIVLGMIHAVLMTWLHTERIPELGIVETMLNTPALHRVHHSRNPIHADKNFGGVLSLWDRAFGTFAPAARVTEYGVIELAHSERMLEAHVAPLRHLARRVRNEETARGRVEALLTTGRDSRRARR